jgi:hypothetical protein
MIDAFGICNADSTECRRIFLTVAAPTPVQPSKTAGAYPAAWAPPAKAAVASCHPHRLHLLPIFQLPPSRRPGWSRRQPRPKNTQSDSSTQACEPTAGMGRGAVGASPGAAHVESADHAEGAAHAGNR